MEGNLGDLIGSADLRPGGGNFGSWAQVAAPEANFPRCKDVYPVYYAASRGYSRILKCVLEYLWLLYLESRIIASRALKCACLSSSVLALQPETKLEGRKKVEGGSIAAEGGGGEGRVVVDG